MLEAERQPGERLLGGRYRLAQTVGRGSAGVVHRAEDTVDGSTVAVKVLRDPQSTPGAAWHERGLVDVLLRLRHPSLVDLLDARLEPGHPHYLVMEFVEGPTLGARIASGALPGAEVAGIATDLGGALDALHTAGVVHRDVKPSNVLLASADRPEASWQAKLTDFGAAITIDGQPEHPRFAIGTAPYMAPEQVRGRRLSGATDVYALGLVLIEALTGQAVYPARADAPTAYARLVQPPEVPTSLEAGWRTLLSDMVHADPARRPSAAQVAEAAAALQAG